MKFKYRITLLALMVLLVLPFKEIIGQQKDDDQFLVGVENALQANSAKELTRFVQNNIEIRLNREKKTYSSKQAEMVLKTFFQENPATDFEFIHDGNNNSGGIIYAIGNYISLGGTHRVVIRAKKVGEDFKIYRLEFTKEQ